MKNYKITLRTVAFSMGLGLGLIGIATVDAQDGESPPVIEQKHEELQAKPIDFQNLFADSGAESGSAIVHEVPDRPFVVNGVRYQPEEISQFDGQALEFVLNKAAEKEGVFYAFTTTEDLLAYLQLGGSDGLEQSASETVAPTSGSNLYSNFYDQPRFRKWMFGLRVRSWGNLARWANNDISSVRTANYGSWTVLADCYNLSRRCGIGRLWLRHNGDYARLGRFNNRASSVAVLR